jgi:hypothetical protein
VLVFRRALMLAALLAVAGCGHYEWRRISPNPGDFSQADYSCQRDSLQVAPVAVVQEVERTKNERRVTTHDVNQGNRSSLFYTCMRAHGWDHVYVSDQARAPVAAVAPVAPPPPTVAYAQPPAAAPAPSPGRSFDPSGSWRADDENLTLTLQPGGVLQGQYPDGTIAGRLTGNVFEGTWREASGDRACRRTADGVYWGRVSFEFAPDGRNFRGRWGYCDDAPAKPWNGTR